MSDITLTSEQKAFAERCVASGRFPDLDSVVGAGLELLSVAEQRKTAFAAMLEDTVAEGERLGWVDLDAMDAELDELVRNATTER